MLTRLLGPGPADPTEDDRRQALRDVLGLLQPAERQLADGLDDGDLGMRRVGEQHEVVAIAGGLQPLRLDGPAQALQLFFQSLVARVLLGQGGQFDLEAQIAAPRVVLILEPVGVDEPGGVVGWVGLQLLQEGAFLGHGWDSAGGGSWTRNSTARGKGAPGASRRSR